ncbi:laminin subunit gamma-2 [Ambystoma mexicanum]|uniref:laminin subunit gamma-2 n=1 Tax=Ambystoma mexicanum TaxID=8296 RepID=UPI0037E73DE4
MAWLTAILTLGCCLALHLPTAAGTTRREVCDCNGRSSQCIFDRDLWRRTGQGFRCLNCLGNTDGLHCERCKEGHYKSQGSPGEVCLPCKCNPTGAIGAECDVNGRCDCKPGVMGEKCDRCQPGFHSLTQAGCTREKKSMDWSCDCDPLGSLGRCDTATGRCHCKASVTGDRCDRCKPGYFYLDAQHPEGCSQCFCYGHSSSCRSAQDFSVYEITSLFQQDTEGWRAVRGNGSPASLRWSPRHHDVYATSRQADPVYYKAPAKFLGNQLVSYGQELSFNYRVDRGGRRPSTQDVVLEGAGFRIAAPLDQIGSTLPCGITKRYMFRLDELPGSKWSPQLSRFEYHQLLRNLTAIHIRGTYGEYSTGYMGNVTLVSARPITGAPAPWVERCACPPEYHGQFCQRCAPGFRRKSAGLGPFSTCVACNCQGGGVCDPDTGDCYAGDENPDEDCPECPAGSYNDPQDPRSCKPCPCREGFGCSVMPETEEVVCNTCPAGVTGARCDICADGYFGDPLGQRGPARPCSPCRCNSNIDPLESENCDRWTGECLKCLHNTGGFNCERCREGFFGNPMATNPADKCKACSCHPVGAESKLCQMDGTCRCKAGFEGPRCQHPRCPTCYGEIQSKVDLHRLQLTDLEAVVSGIQVGDITVNNKELDAKIQQVQETARDMKKEAETLEASDRSLQSRMSKVKAEQAGTQQKMAQVQGKADGMQTLAGQYQGQMQETRRLIEKARLELEGSKVTLKEMNIPSSGSSALAQEALELANRHTQEAAAVERAAQEAQGDSATALDLLRTALTAGGSGLGVSVQGLTKRLDAMKAAAGELEADGLSSAAAAEREYRSSLQVSNAFTELPDISAAALQLQASRARQEATSVTGALDRSIAEYRTLQGNLASGEAEAKQLLQRGESGRMKAGQLLARANAAKARAQEALSTGNATFYEVEEILKNLRGFDLKVDGSRAEAEDAMRRLPVIKQRVDQATGTTARAEAALGSASTDASTASGVASQAQGLSAGIGLGLQQLNMDVNGTADRVLALERGIAALRKQGGEVEGELESKARGAEGDATVVQATMQTAQNAELHSRNANAAVEDTLGILDGILRLMDRPVVVNEEGVRLLNESLSTARMQVHGRLRSRMAEMEEAAGLQRRRILSLEGSIEQILVDIENLEDIKRSLPPNCFNTPTQERP